MMTVDEFEASEVTYTEAGELLGITRRRVAQLVDEGWIVSVGRGKTTLGHAARGYIRLIDQRAERRSHAQDRSRLNEAKAVEIETRVARRMRELIPVDDCLTVIEEYTECAIEALNVMRRKATLAGDMSDQFRVEIDAVKSIIRKQHLKVKTALKATL